jgi:hypothetical protein
LITSLTNFSRPRKGGIIAIELRDGDKLVGVDITSGENDIMLFSDILCDSTTTNKFHIVISKNPMLVIWIFFCTMLNCTITIFIYFILMHQ